MIAYPPELKVTSSNLVLPAGRITRVLDRILAWRGFPEKMRMNNGPELISVTLADWAEKIGAT